MDTPILDAVPAKDGTKRFDQNCCILHALMAITFEIDFDPSQHGRVTIKTS